MKLKESQINPSPITSVTTPGSESIKKRTDSELVELSKKLTAFINLFSSPRRVAYARLVEQKGTRSHYATASDSAELAEFREETDHDGGEKK